MRQLSRKSILGFLSILFGMGTASWSNNSHACAYEPMISGVCVLAAGHGSPMQSINQTHLFAADQQFPVNDYAALSSLIGFTYGGDNSTAFNVPGLRGKVIAGYDLSDPAFGMGKSGLSEKSDLAIAQLPQPALIVSDIPLTHPSRDNQSS